MGNLIAGSMGEQMKKNQELMQQMNKIKVRFFLSDVLFTLLLTEGIGSC